jgi:hypothetical protein
MSADVRLLCGEGGEGVDVSRGCVVRAAIVCVCVCVCVTASRRADSAMLVYMGR